MSRKIEIGGVKDKIIDRLVCINDVPDDYDWIVHLTVGKIYDVYRYKVSVSGYDVVILDDDSESLYYYRTSRFISVSEYRLGVINEILNL